jgi:hypothetical protein
MMLDDIRFYITSAATIRKVLEVTLHEMEAKKKKKENGKGGR